MNTKKAAPIGIFDSGVGGLTVVLEVFQQIPNESFIYYGDTAHVPYGPRDPQELKGFASAITEFLVKQGCKLIIIACNTSTSLAYEELKKRHPLPLIGVIEPGVDKALETTANGKIGVIGTVATINSGVYQKMLIEKNPDVEVEAVSCPLYVPFIEQGQLESEKVYQATETYMESMKEKGIDTLILGCTHYPFLSPVITKVLGPSVAIINPAKETVRRAVQSLREQNLLNEGIKPVYQYYASGDPIQFQKMGATFLKRELTSVKGITLKEQGE